MKKWNLQFCIWTWIIKFLKITCIKDLQCFENFSGYIMIVDWETCGVRITCHWCNQLVNMLGMYNLKPITIFWTQGGYYLKKVKNTSIEI
jgi:hypothetical protein